jgi:hypothetical protein
MTFQASDDGQKWTPLIAIDNDSSRVSHYRALALAFEALGDGAAAKPLGEAMQRLEIRGMAVTDTAG